MRPKLVSVVLAIIGIIWWLLMLVLGAFSGKFTEILCIVLFAVLFACVIYNIEHHSSESGKPYHMAFLYLGIACIALGMIFNTAWLFLDSVISTRVALAVNILLIGVYVVASILLRQSIGDHEDRMGNARQAKDSILEVMEPMNRILGAITDPDLKKEFLRVKEAVEYGPKTDLTTGRIEEMKAALDAVRKAVAENESKEHILEQIRAAGILWKSGIAK